MGFKDPKKKREYERLWRQRNREKIREQQGHYRMAHLEEVRERHRNRVRWLYKNNLYLNKEADICAIMQ